MSYIMMSDGSAYEDSRSKNELVEEIHKAEVEWWITGDGDYIRVSQIARIIEKPKTDTDDDFGTLFEAMFHRTKEDE